MNQILEWLTGGDLRSDGMSNEVVTFVLDNIEVFDELFAGLSEPDDVVRGRTADALEKIARSRPEMFVRRLPELIEILMEDQLPMVRWHIAMTLGHLACYEERVDEISLALLDLLNDPSVFVRSWAIVSLCIIGRKYPRMRELIVGKVAPLRNDGSIAIRSKVRSALVILTNESVPFPDGWIKSNYLGSVETE